MSISTIGGGILVSSQYGALGSWTTGSAPLLDASSNVPIGYGQVVSDNAGDVLTAITADSQGVYSTVNISSMHYPTVAPATPTFRPSPVPTIKVPSLSLTPSAGPTCKPSAVPSIGPSAHPTTVRPSTTLRPTAHPTFTATIPPTYVVTLSPTVDQDLVWNQLPSSALVNSTSHFTGVASDSTGQHLALINKNDYLISSDFGKVYI
jgi:hypothetical protein